MLFAPGWQTLANKGALHITTKHKCQLKKRSIVSACNVIISYVLHLVLASPDKLLK